MLKLVGKMFDNENIPNNEMFNISGVIINFLQKDNLSKDKIGYFSKRFAAKEAFAKALGTGFRNNLNFKDIEIINDKLGKPYYSKTKKITQIIKKEFKVKQSKPVVICIFDKNSMKEYIGLQTLLRNAGISTEIYPGESKLKKQMEYANKIKSPAVILFGENEIKSGKPTLRDLNSGNEKSIEIKELVNEIKKII